MYKLNATGIVFWSVPLNSHPPNAITANKPAIVPRPLICVNSQTTSRNHLGKLFQVEPTMPRAILTTEQDGYSGSGVWEHPSSCPSSGVCCQCCCCGCCSPPCWGTLTVRHLFQGESCFFLFQLFAISSQLCTKDGVCWLTWSQWITRKKIKKDELGDCFRIKSPVCSRIWGKKDVSRWGVSMASKNINATLNCHSILKIILKDSACANSVPQNKKLQSKTPYCHLPQNSKNNVIIIGLEVLIFGMTVLSIQGLRFQFPWHLLIQISNQWLSVVFIQKEVNKPQ